MANIAFYIADTSPSGITRYAYNMVACLSEFGHQCKVISDTNLASVDQVNTIILSEKDNIGSFKIRKRILLLKKELERNDIDVVISNGWYHDMIALAASRVCKSKPFVIGVVHTRPELWGLTNNKLKRALKSMLIKSIYAAEDATISVSESLSISLKKNGWIKDPKTIYNPIVSKRIHELSRIRRIPNTPVKLACMGWISPVKGFDTAIKALYEIKKVMPVTLTIIGAENDERYLLEIKRLISKLGLENEVIFIGALKDPFDLLDQMDVFILPSRSEALPTALIEAMGIGLPVVACDCNFGPREILADGEFGVLVPVNDGEKIAEEVIKIVLDSILYTQMSGKGIERAKIFDFTSSGKKYQNLINRKNKSRVT